MSDLKRELIEYMAGLETFDSHEHLVPEAERLAGRMDFTVFVAMYVKSDLVGAGMDPGDCRRMLDDPDLTEAERFALFEPWEPMISQSGYYRAARIAMKAFYGVDRITRATYVGLGEAMRAANQPGLYRRVLKERCHLGHIVNQKVFCNDEGGLFHFNCHVGFYHGPTWEDMRDRFAEQEVTVDIVDLESYEAALESLFAIWRGKGMLALKMGVWEMSVPDRAEADTIVRSIRRDGSVSGADGMRLRTYVMDWFLKKAREHGYVMAVHTGAMASGGDFRKISPCLLMDWAARYPDVKFDMYHMGITEARRAGFVAKYFPNVAANLCWGHVVAPQLLVNVLDEWLDYVPLNKIIAFGGDYSGCVEKVYGALVMTREHLAEVMVRRVGRGVMDVEEAKWALERMLVRNGESWYGLEGKGSKQ